MLRSMGRTGSRRCPKPGKRKGHSTILSTATSLTSNDCMSMTSKRRTRERGMSWGMTWRGKSGKKVSLKRNVWNRLVSIRSTTKSSWSRSKEVLIYCLTKSSIMLKILDHELFMNLMLLNLLKCGIEWLINQMVLRLWKENLIQMLCRMLLKLILIFGTLRESWLNEDHSDLLEVLKSVLLQQVKIRNMNQLHQSKQSKVFQL